MRMRTVMVTTVAACLVGAAAWAMASKQKAGDAAAAKVVLAEKGSQVVVYYLHGNYRCQTCLSIEAQAKAAVEEDFREELKAGKVVFLSLNYEVPENDHFTADYRLTTRSLVLSLRKDGKEVRWKNLPEIWAKVRLPPDFRAYVDAEVKAMLKEAS